MAERTPISKRLRFEVLKRDRFECQYCGAQPPKVPLEVDHILPVSKGGMNNRDNLITACFDCNRGKSNIELTDIPRPLADTIERKTLAQSQYSQYKRVLKKERKIIDNEINEIESIYTKHFNDYVFKDRFRLSVKDFIRQIGFDATEQAMEKACVKVHYNEQGALKYFCGICWNIIRGE